MTGIRTVNNPVLWVYECLVLCGIAGFAVYDLFKRRVPDRALAFFCLAAVPSPLIHAWPSIGWPLLHLFFLYYLAGAAAGFLILLSAALFTKSGAGIGGGDIKLAAVLGFIYGIAGITAILLTASSLAAVTALLIQKKHPPRQLSLPFVPFLAVRCLAVNTATFIR